MRPATLRLLPACFSLACSAAAVTAAWAEEAEVTVMEPIVTRASPPRADGLRAPVQAGSKTDTPLRDLPASVVVVPEKTLRDQGVSEMNQALENVSGVQPVMGGGYGFANNYSIRGQAMRFLRDGYFDGTSQNGYWHTFADVAAVEVLKGPGSALYGAGQPGGSVNIVTKKPLRQFGAEVTAGAGSFNQKRGSVDITGPLSEEFAARLIVNGEKTDGWRDLSRDIREVMPSLTWFVSADRTLSIDHDHRELKITPDNYGLIFDSNRRIVPVAQDAKFYSPMNFSDQTIDRTTLSHDWQLTPDLSMRTAVIHDRRRLDMVRNAGGNPGAANGQMTGRNARTQDDEVRYLNLQNEVVWKFGEPGLAHTLLAGIEYTDSDVHTRRAGYALPPITDINHPVVPETTLYGLTAVPAQSFDRDITSTAWGIYVQDQLALGEQVKLRAGLRTERSRFLDEGTQGGTQRSVGDTVHWTTGSLGAVWQPSTTMSFYAGWSNGKFINLSTEPGRVSLEPETSSQLEAGAKWSLLDGKLDVTSAVFETRRDHYYITLPGASDPTPDGRDRTRGVEVDLSGRPLPGLTAAANLILQDAETQSNANATNAQLGVTQSIKGKRPAGVARVSGRVWSAYRLQGELLHGWMVGGGVTYKGASYADSLNLYEVPSYALADLTVGYETRLWDISLNIRNLTDRVHYTNPTFSGALPGEPRSALLSARLRFN